MEWLQKANGDWSVLDGVDKDTWQKWDYNFQGFSIKGIEGFLFENVSNFTDHLSGVVLKRVVFICTKQQVGYRTVNHW